MRDAEKGGPACWAGWGGGGGGQGQLPGVQRAGRAGGAKRRSETQLQSMVEPALQRGRQKDRDSRSRKERQTGVSGSWHCPGASPSAQAPAALAPPHPAPCAASHRHPSAPWSPSPPVPLQLCAIVLPSQPTLPPPLCPSLTAAPASLLTPCHSLTLRSARSPPRQPARPATPLLLSLHPSPCA